MILGVVLHWAVSPAPSASDDTPAAAGASAPAVMWTCSMHPEISLPNPGLCPKCQMKLIPQRTIESGPREFATSEEALALMDIQTAPVQRKFVETVVRMVGKVDYDETRLAYITAWVPGRLDRLFVDYTGVEVRKGDHMVELFSPELLSAQEELLQAVKATVSLADSDVEIVRERTEATVQIARDRLQLWGLSNEQVAEIERRGTAADRITINAPTGGIVIHRNAQQGMYVKTGTRIYTIADLSKLWVNLEAFESDLMWLRYGQQVEFTSLAAPGEPITGTIAFISPVLNEQTRTVTVRVNVDNSSGVLKPGMFVKAAVRAGVGAAGRVMDKSLAGKWICPMHPSVIADEPGQCPICEMALVTTESLGYVSADAAQSERPLVVPETAVLKTGARAVVYVRRDPSLLTMDQVADWANLIATIRPGHAMQPTPAAEGGFLNTTCPIMGTPLDLANVPAELTRSFQGGKVAFCCAGCPQAWDELSHAEKRAKVAGPAAEDSPIQALRRLLGQPLLAALTAAPSGADPPHTLHRRFVDAVNGILRGRDLYDPERWTSVQLPDEANELLDAGFDRLEPMKRTRLNRLLLEALLPNAITKAKNRPVFQGRQIVLGPRAGNYYIVHSGLAEGERVVTRGNFKIDSALQIMAKPSMMSPEGHGGSGGHQHD